MKLPLQFFGGAPDDYPHLNKCPDCETFFADLTCPLCGKICPEDMRAGNRKPPKQKWEDPYRRGGNRVQFVPWYFSAWFIIVMLFVFPIAGLILLWTGYWKKKWKILATVLYLGLMALPYVLVFALQFVHAIWGQEQITVDLEMPRAQYVELCQAADVDVEGIFRNPDNFADSFVAMEVTVKDVYQNYNVEKYNWYYRCVAEVNGREYTFLMRDFRGEGSSNLTPGDRITVYGQVMGNVEISTYEEDLRGPCIAMRFAELVPDSSAARRVDSAFVLATA